MSDRVAAAEADLRASLPITAQQAVFGRTLRATFKGAAQCGGEVACICGLAVAQQAAHATPCVVGVQTA